MKEVSVIVSTYSKARLGYVTDCIKSLKTQSLRPKEIILVLDPDQSLIEAYKAKITNDVKVIICEGYGLSKARNAGINNAKGEIVAFIDDDAVADKDWLNSLVKNYGDPEVTGVGGLAKPLWRTSRPLWFPEELDWIVGCTYKGFPEAKSIVRNPIGCNMSFRRSVFRKVGYFQNGLGKFGNKPLVGEETELSIRVWEKLSNPKILYDPSAVVYHRISRHKLTLAYLIKRSLYEGLSKAFIVNSRSDHLKKLYVEKNYLKYLFRVAIPAKLRQIYKLENIAGLIIMVLSVCLVSVGYLLGRLTEKKMER